MKEIQTAITKLRNEKGEICQRLTHLEKIYDLQKLKNATIRQLSEHRLIGKDELLNHLVNGFEQLQRGNCYDAISSCSRAAEMLVAGIFIRLKGEKTQDEHLRWVISSRNFGRLKCPVK